MLTLGKTRVRVTLPDGTVLPRASVRVYNGTLKITQTGQQTATVDEEAFEVRTVAHGWVVVGSSGEYRIESAGCGCGGK